MPTPISPCLWFDGNAKEAVDFYTSLFPDSRITQTTHYGENAPLPAGTVMTISFELGDRPFMAINGSDQFQFSPAISMMAHCETQEELDRLWEALLDGGEAQACGII